MHPAGKIEGRAFQDDSLKFTHKSVSCQACSAPVCFCLFILVFVGVLFYFFFPLVPEGNWAEVMSESFASSPLTQMETAPWKSYFSEMLNFIPEIKE